MPPSIPLWEVGVGIAWASILSLPYALLSSNLPANKMGIYMGIFNFFIVIPQLAAASVLGLLLREFFGGEAIYGLVIGGVLMVLAAWLSRTVETALSRSVYLSSGVKIGLSKTIKLVIYTLAGLLSLNAVGIDLSALAIFGGALGVGLGFGLQRIASNFISGFILVFDRSIRPRE